MGGLTKDEEIKSFRTALCKKVDQCQVTNVELRSTPCVHVPRPSGTCVPHCAPQKIWEVGVARELHLPWSLVMLGQGQGPKDNDAGLHGARTMGWHTRRNS